MSKLNEQQRLALAAALSLAIGVATGDALHGDDAATLPEAAQAVGRKLDPSLVVDVAKYRDAVAPAKAACGAACVDLLSGPVEPGASVTTGGNFPKGARIVGDVELTGPAVGAFSAPTWTCRDDEQATWCEVTARNTGTKAQRFLALVRTSP